MNECEEMYINELIAQKRYYEAGKEYLALGNYDEAKKCFDEYCYDEVEEDDWKELGYGFFKIQEYEEAIECFQNTDLTFEEWEKLGYELIKIQEYEEAIECFDNADEDGYFIIGEYFLKQNDYVMAKEYFQNTDLTFEEWEKLGYELIKIQEYEEAIECFDNADKSGNYVVGKYFIEKGDLITGKKYFERTFIINDFDWEELGYKFIENNQLYEAKECFEHLYYSNDECWENLGECFLKKGYEFEAKECFEHIYYSDFLICKYYLESNLEKGIDYLKNNNNLEKLDIIYLLEIYLTKIEDDNNILDSKNLVGYFINKINDIDFIKEVYFILAKWYLNKNNILKAEEYLLKSEISGYRYFYFYFQICKFYIKNDYSKSRKYFEKLIDFIAKNNEQEISEQILNEQIFVALKLNENDIAKRYLEEISKKNFNFENIYIGIYEFLNKNYDEAIKVLENIQENDNNILYNFKNLYLGKAYYCNKNYGEAKDFLEKVVKEENDKDNLKESIKLEANITLAEILYKQNEFKNSEKYCFDALKLDYSNKQVFNILLNIYIDINLFNKSKLIDKIKEILNNENCNKIIFCIMLKDFILNLKDLFKNRKLSTNYYNLVKECLKIDYNSIYKKLYNINNENISNHILEIYIICEKILKEQEFNFDDKQSKLGHYTTKAGAMSILSKDARLRLKNAIYANDPQEGELLKNLIIPKNNKKDNKKDNLIPLEQYNNKNIYFTCFSTNIDTETSLPMWVHYADKTEGCILEFDKDFLEHNDIISSRIKTDLSVGKLYNVMYLKEEDIEDIKNKIEGENTVINLIIELKQKLNTLITEDNINALNIVDEILDYVSFIFKRNHFEYEKEVRLLKRVEDISKVNIDNKVVPELYVNFEKEVKCKGVILGAKCTDIDAISRFLAYRGINSCKKSELIYR